MSLNYKLVEYKNKRFAVISIKYKDYKLPVTIDWNDLDIIKKQKVNWKCNKYGFISCLHTIPPDNIKEVFIHEIIMALKMRDEGGETHDASILHINRTGLDNRRSNLIYNIPNKHIKNNIKKKKRTIKLPMTCGIDPDEIPTYVWYMKANNSHGERFMISIGNIKWKTTSKKNLSLRYKLEEAKTYLRQLRITDPDIFEEYSMNGDYTKQGKILAKEYYDIVYLAGYKHISRYIPDKRTDEILKPMNYDIFKKHSSSNKKDNIRQNIDKLPKYCHYKPAYNSRGEYFIVNNHPKQIKTWRSSSSKNISLDDKYKQLQTYLDKINDNTSSSNSSNDSSYTLYS